MRVAIKQVDAFSDVPFGGNPAGVVLNAEGLDDAAMLGIAREMNLSETAFVTPSDVADFRVRFFTPRREVDLCGHATIGTFAALEEEGRLAKDRTTFTQETGAGVLPVEIQREGPRPLIMMTQALPTFREASSRTEVAALLRIDADELLDLPVAVVSTGLPWLTFGLRSLKTLSGLRPDFPAIAKASREGDYVGFSVFSPETLKPESTYHIRSFAPVVNIDEDPVCGTCNGCVSAYVVNYRVVPLSDRVCMTAEAGYGVDRPGRVSTIVERRGDRITAVRVGGPAVTVLDGAIETGIRR